MEYRYGVIGAGRQGLYAAYDLGRFGRAGEILLFDIDEKMAQDGAERLNNLLNMKIARGCGLDARKPQALAAAFRGMDALISAVPYKLNLRVTRAALSAGCHVCDLGGHTETVREQLKLDSAAKKAGMAIVPDCGMAPGLNISMAVQAMSKVEEPRQVFIWDGGLPLNPKPPWTSPASDPK